MEQQDAEIIVEAIIADLTDRGGLQNEWEAIEQEATEQLRLQLVGIVMREDDPDVATEAMISDLSAQEGLDHVFGDMEAEMLDSMRQTWKAIFKKREEIAQAVREQLDGKIAEARPMLDEHDPEFTGIANETDLRRFAINMALIGVQGEILREDLEDKEEV